MAKGTGKDGDEFEQARRGMAAARARHRAAVDEARKAMRVAIDQANAEMHAAHSEFQAAMERARCEAGARHKDQGRIGRGRKGSWWNSFLRAQGRPPNPPRRPRDGGEPAFATPRPKPSPLEGGAEAPIE